MESATIIIPSKHADIFNGCEQSLKTFAPQAPKILIKDGNEIVDPPGWTVISGIAPFIFSRNVNLGIKACTGDVLLMNDDVQFRHPNTVEKLQEVMESHPEVGILSPKVSGLAGNVVCNPNDRITISDKWIAFVCVLIRRSVFEKIGLLDETFTGYGEDDVDFCYRAHTAGIKIAITSEVTVNHGHKRQQSTSSFSRRKNFRDLVLESGKRFAEKWGSAAGIRDWAGSPPPKQVRRVYTNNGLTIDWWSRHPRRK